MNRLLVILLLLSSISANARKFVVKQLGMDKGLSSNYILSIAQDKRGYMWFATEEGLNRFDGLQFYTYYKNGTKGKGLTGNELNCLLDDPKQPILWIGTQRDGINAYNYADNSFTYYRHDKKNPHSLITNDITNIRPAADGNIWITTFWKGIDYYNKKTGQFIQDMSAMVSVSSTRGHEGRRISVIIHYLLSLYQVMKYIASTATGSGIYGSEPIRDSICSILPVMNLSIMMTTVY